MRHVGIWGIVTEGMVEETAFEKAKSQNINVLLRNWIHRDSWDCKKECDVEGSDFKRKKGKRMDVYRRLQFAGRLFNTVALMTWSYWHLNSL